MITVATYNILSSELSKPSYYFKCPEYVCEPEYRFNIITRRLRAHALLNQILCLQEVSLEWENRLQVFFKTINYTFISKGYGKAHTGYMGVAIAFPNNIYNLNEVHTKCIGEIVSSGYSRQESPSWIQSLTKLLSPKSNLNEPDPYTVAKNKKNMAIVLTLSIAKTGKKFTLATYHMPCAFYLPKVMLMHSEALINYVDDIADGLPYIIAGDFNMQPSDVAYKLTTTGRYRNFKISSPLKSAYKECHGKEPFLTNHAWSGSLDKVFSGCLDYIFYNGKINPTHTRDLKYDIDHTLSKASLPSDKEPSDHLLISADFNLQ